MSFSSISLSRLFLNLNQLLIFEFVSFHFALVLIYRFFTIRQILISPTSPKITVILINVFILQQDNVVQHELLKRVEDLGDDFFQALADDIGDDDEDTEGFSAAENYPLSVISLISNQDDPESSIGKKRYKTLKGHTPTRWHSILMMLESLGTQRLAVSRTLYRISSKYSITESDWDLVYQLIDFLKIFRSAVEVFSFDRKPTLPCTLVFRTEIVNALKINCKDHLLIVELKENMAENLDKRFPVTEELLIAAVLDPRLSNLPILSKELDKLEMSKFQFLKSQMMTISSSLGLQSTQPEAQSPQTRSSNAKKPPSLLSTLIEKHAYEINESSNLKQIDRVVDEEIHKYFLTVIPKGEVESFDILQFWKNHSATSPNLAELAKKILCIPATSVSSERAFSHAGILVNAKRSSLGPSVINKTLFLHDNYSIIKRIVFSSV